MAVYKKEVSKILKKEKPKSTAHTVFPAFLPNIRPFLRVE